MIAVSALVAGRAVGGHVTLPLLVVVRGLPFLGLVLVRPNEVTLAIGGAQASDGRLPWTLLFIAAVVGAVVSDSLSYALGRTAGEAALSRLLSHGRGHGRLGRIVERSRRLVARHGVLAVAAARPTVISHGVVPVLAGVARLPAPRFVVASMTGAAIWAAAWLGGAVVVVDALRGGDRLVIVIAVAMVAVGAAIAVRECLRRPACLRRVA
ncbi:MAG: DedA family protein [Microthrixaceae bacterium]